MKALENIDKGDAIRFREEVWYVSKKDLYDVSAIYHETQWTLTNQDKNIVYLLFAQEKINNEWQKFWIVTKEISLSNVQFQAVAGGWESINPSDIPEEPPQAAQYGGREYRFHAKNIGKAENDDGNETTKITWDYIDESQKYNLAIELWEEDNKLYPEAYSGENMMQTEFEIVPYLPLRRVFPNTGLLIAIGIMMGIIGFIWIFAGPFDYFLSWSVPFFLVMRLMISYIPLTWFISLCTAIISSIILTMYFNTFWTTGIVYLWGAVLIFRWLLSFIKRMENERLGFLSWGGILPASWIYSFSVYLSYAPSPHEFYQLMAACVLPLMVSGTCFIIIHLTEALWLNRN